MQPQMATFLMILFHCQASEMLWSVIGETKEESINGIHIKGIINHSVLHISCVFTYKNYFSANSRESTETH